MSAIASAFRTQLRPDGVLLLIMDVPDEAMNTFKAGFVDQLNRVLDTIESDSDARAVVISSGKPDSFIAGADISMLQQAQSAEAATRLSRAAQQVLARVEESGMPFVAAIHGACLGGGLELTLVCRARVASSDPRTRLGLPEVQLGLLPGLGGTQRLPRLIGVQAALDLMLTGRQIQAQKARSLGLVDDVVPAPILVEVAAQRALQLAQDPPRKTTLEALKGLFDRDELTELALVENPLGRKVLFDQAKKQVRRKTQGNYPAPETILEVVRVGLERGLRAGLAREAEAFGELCATQQAGELMRLFFVTQELKKDRGVSDSGVVARPVTKLGILGAGLMGAGIAYVTAASAGVGVRLKDKDRDGVSHGLAHVRGLFDERVKRRRLTTRERDRMLYGITGTSDYSGFQGCELVIEAVFEDLGLKRRMLAEVEAQGHPEAIFASNTSAIPIAAIASQAKAPERVIGMHYFSPVHKMPLLEIIATEKTAPWVIATAVALGKKQGKTVIVVNDGVGFYTSRVLAPYLNEAAFLLGEGVPIEAIDHALVQIGFPVGPIALLDEVGIDVATKVASTLFEAFGSRMMAPPGMARLVQDGRLGRKAKRGFYRYAGDLPKGPRPVDPSVYTVLEVSPERPIPAEKIAQRCLLQLVNEALLCLEQGVLRSARDGDAGAVFGLGFPPYLGGPLRYVDGRGAKTVLAELEALKREHGERFEPAPLLKRLAAEDETLYPR